MRLVYFTRYIQVFDHVVFRSFFVAFSEVQKDFVVIWRKKNSFWQLLDFLISFIVMNVLVLESASMILIIENISWCFSSRKISITNAPQHKKPTKKNQPKKTNKKK